MASLLFGSRAAAGVARLRVGAQAGLGARLHSSSGYGYGPGPLHGHPLGHATPMPMVPGYEMAMHATTILSVRKGGVVVSAACQGAFRIHLTSSAQAVMG